LSADGAPDGRSRAVRAVGRTDPRETRSVRRGRFGAETYAPVARAPKRRDPYDVADLEPKRTRGRPYGPPKGAIRTTRPIWSRNVRAVDCTDPQEARSVRRGRFGAETYARSAVRTPKRRDPHDAADLRPNLTRGRPYGPPRAAIRTTWPVFATNGYGPPYAPRRPARTMLPILARHIRTGPVGRTLTMLSVLTTSECGACRTDPEKPRSVRCCRLWPEAYVRPTVRTLGRPDPAHVDAFLPKRPSRDLWRPGSAQFRCVRRWECRPLDGQVRPVPLFRSRSSLPGLVLGEAPTAGRSQFCQNPHRS
jgi:hypothetical protein